MTLLRSHTFLAYAEAELRPLAPQPGETVHLGEPSLRVTAADRYDRIPVEHGVGEAQEAVAIISEEGRDIGNGMPITAVAEWTLRAQGTSHHKLAVLQQSHGGARCFCFIGPVPVLRGELVFLGWGRPAGIGLRYDTLAVAIPAPSAALPPTPEEKRA